ncbi:MAG: ferrous iron transport protein B [Bacteroidia bacterium]|nr:ferrous iron transport protein B [Bacteroidia bacterium]
MKKIALIGNPNCGKTTLFNAITGLNQKVGNFPGVTVEKIEGSAKIHGESYSFIDLPGTYSINPKSPDEEVVFSVLSNPQHPDFPDAVILVADASNLKRSLFVLTQVLELNIPCLIALNMMDVAKEKGIEINLELLSENLGVPIIPISARSGFGIPSLLEQVSKGFSLSTKNFVNLDLIDHGVSAYFQAQKGLPSRFAGFYFANHFARLEKNNDLKEKFNLHLIESSFEPQVAQRQESILRFKFLQELKETATRQTELPNKNFSGKMDELLTHKFFGLLLFFVILLVVFQSVYLLSEWPMEWIDYLMSGVRSELKSMLNPGLLKDLLLDGVLAGITGIVIFIPQIALLFGFISVLEETGYMARVSYMMDKVMRPFGLNGRSIIPLISGIACAVPSILATRTIGSPKERLLTILVTPFMSCSARLPVYTLMIALVIPSGSILGILSYQGLTLLSLYFLGLIMALVISFLIKGFIKEDQNTLFAFDLPPYRSPRWKSVGISVYTKIKSFLGEAGGVIMAISIVLWAMASFGPSDEMAQVQQQYENRITENPKDSLLAMQQFKSEKLEHSFAGKLGQGLEPLIKPLGFDWKIGIALVTSFAAREVFVGTMNTIYSVEETDETPVLLLERMKMERRKGSNRLYFDLPTGISLMVFYAFAMQCMSTLAVVKSETKSWKWPLMQFFWMGAIAWISSWIAYQLFS